MTSSDKIPTLRNYRRQLFWQRILPGLEAACAAYGMHIGIEPVDVIDGAWALMTESAQSGAPSTRDRDSPVG
jgi:hypothetical protein